MKLKNYQVYIFIIYTLVFLAAILSGVSKGWFSKTEEFIIIGYMLCVAVFIIVFITNDAISFFKQLIKNWNKPFKF